MRLALIAPAFFLLCACAAEPAPDPGPAPLPAHPVGEVSSSTNLPPVHAAGDKDCPNKNCQATN